jgi:hypothetical protein
MKKITLLSLLLLLGVVVVCMGVCTFALILLLCGALQCDDDQWVGFLQETS